MPKPHTPMRQCPQCRAEAITWYMGGQFGKYLCKSCGYIGPVVLEGEPKAARVVIAGAGFGGLEAAWQLKRLLGKAASVTVINQSEHHYFIPALMDIATHHVEEHQAAICLPDTLRRHSIAFLRARIHGIDRKAKQVLAGKKKIPYDYLVLAVGSETSTYGIDGVDKHAQFLKTWDDALLLGKELTALLGKKKESRIAIAGAGVTGVQLAYAIRDYAKNASITLLDARDAILKELPAAVRERVSATLRRKKIDFMPNAMIEKVGKGRVHLKGRKAVSADLIIWVAGITAPKMVRGLGLDCSPGGILVNEYLQSTNDESVFSVGDCMCLADEHLRKRDVKRAQSAHWQGRLAAKNIALRIRGKKMTAYSPQAIPTIVALRADSVLQYRNLVVQGRLIGMLENFIRIRHMLAYTSASGWLFRISY